MNGDYARSTISVSALTILSRVTGMIKLALLGAALALGRIADAYSVANILPNMIYEFIMGGIITAVFIPLFVEYVGKDEGEHQAWERANVILGFALFVLAIVTILAAVAAPWAIKLQTLLIVDEENRRLAVYFFRIFAMQMVFYGVSAIFSGILNTFRHFALPAFAPIMNNVTVIATVILYLVLPGFGYTGLAVGTTLGVAMMAAVQAPLLIKLGMPLRPRLNLRHPIIATVVQLALPVIGYIAINQIGLIVRTNLAYQFPGGFAAMQWGFSFFQLPYGIFAVALATVLYPTLSRYAVDKDWAAYRDTFSTGMRWTSLIMLPVSLGYALISYPAIRIIMEHGKFTQANTELLASILFYYSLGLFSYSLYMFTTRVFYSLRDTRTPMLINAIGVGINIVGNIILVQYMGVQGLALCTGITYTAMLVLSLRILRERLERLDGKRIFNSLLKMMGATAGMAAWTAYAVNQIRIHTLELTILPQIAALIGLIFVAGLIYVALAWALRMHELRPIRNLLAGKKS
jgi:putative peptidoglycan lipid II flippase